MAALLNRCLFRASSGGTGTFTVSAAITGHLTPAQAGAVDATVYSYFAESDDKTQWEIGTGTYTVSGTTLSRTPLKSSNAGAAVNFSSAPRVGITALLADIMQTGRHAYWVPAGSMKARATSGAGAGTYDSGANDVTIATLDFDTTTQEYAHFSVAMPKSWNEGTVTAKFFWTNTGGASTQTVRWSLAGRALSDDDAINGTFGTAQVVDDTWLAQNDLHVSGETAAITIGGSPAAEDLVVFEVTRVVASDNMAGDASLIGVMLYLTLDAGNDV